MGKEILLEVGLVAGGLPLVAAYFIPSIGAMIPAWVPAVGAAMVVIAAGTAIAAKLK